MVLLLSRTQFCKMLGSFYEIDYTLDVCFFRPHQSARKAIQQTYYVRVGADIKTATAVSIVLSAMTGKYFIVIYKTALCNQDNCGAKR